ncbi:hypothetical protein OIU79_001145 [Salix purpurea]|uniref:Uncharacterized protein n=1 Tax=Salix purpurea TaxID=77065 RepID=A0A9Q0V4V6_SALPP|nr:hypothetical protein OIU79_001145 [Salix purpurea]
MGAISCEQESWISSRKPKQVEENDQTHNVDFLDDEVPCQETEQLWLNMHQNNTLTKSFNKGSLQKIQRKKSPVLLEGYDEIPELCNTLPALELCYSMSQRFLDEHQKSPERSSPAVAEAASPSPFASWKISSPGDHPEDVKARLKYWAQAVACTLGWTGQSLCNDEPALKKLKRRKRNVSVVRTSPIEPSPDTFRPL